MEKITQTARKLAIKLIRFYQKYCSPNWNPKCRFQPTCSSYAILAIQKHPLKFASKLIIIRLLKCRPGGASGVDFP